MMISIDEDVKKKCKEKGIIVSKVCNEYLKLVCGGESARQDLLNEQRKHMAEVVKISTQLQALEQEGLSPEEKEKVEPKNVNEAIEKLMNRMGEIGNYDPEMAENLAIEYGTTAESLFTEVMKRLDGE